MKKLLKQEFYTQFKTKNIFLNFFVIFMCIFCFYLYNNYQDYNYVDDRQNQLFENINKLSENSIRLTHASYLLHDKSINETHLKDYEENKDYYKKASLAATELLKQYQYKSASFEKIANLENEYYSLIIDSRGELLNLLSGESKDEVEAKIIINNHLLSENSVSLENEYIQTTANFLANVFNSYLVLAVLFITILTILNVVLDEFKYSLQKIIYTNAKKRTMILASKILYVILSVLLITVISISLVAILAYIQNGLGDFTYPVPIHPSTIENPIIISSLQKFLYSLLMFSSLVVFTTSLFFYIAYKLRNSETYVSAAVVFVFFLVFLRSSALFRFIKYIPSLNYDFNSLLIRGEGLNMTSLVSISILSSILLFYLTYINLKTKDLN